MAALTNTFSKKCMIRDREFIKTDQQQILERKDIESLASHPRQRREVLSEPDTQTNKPEAGYVIDSAVSRTTC